MIQLQNRICIITGANSGIGKEAAVQMAEQGATVIIACRSRERGQKALAEVQQRSGSQQVALMQVDMSSQASIRAFCQDFLEKYPQLDVLVHNAADFDIRRKEAIMSPEGIETVWATNHLGPFLMTNLLWKALQAGGGGRVITVASKGLVVYPRLKIDYADIHFAHKAYSTQKAYYQSKLAQVMYTFLLADKGEKDGITAHCVRVTNVKLDMSRYPDVSALAKLAYKLKSSFSISPAEMARTYTWLAGETAVDGKTGGYWDAPEKPVKASAYCYDKDEQVKLWRFTEEMLGK